MLNRFGDIINQSTLETIYAFEKRNLVKASKDGINWEYLTLDDCNIMFSEKVGIVYNCVVLSNAASFGKFNFSIFR